MAEIKTKETKSKTTVKAKAKSTAVKATVSDKKLHRRTMSGIVVSDKMMKTRVVRIERQVREEKYGKITTKANRFKFHDEDNRSKSGDLVQIIESRPLSKDKRWALQKILRVASGEVLVKG